MGYTTVEDIESYLRTSFDSSTTPTDTQVQQYIEDVSNEIDEMVGTTFSVVSNVVEIFTPRVPSNKFLTKRYPLLSVDKLEYNNGTEFVPDWVEIDSSEYRVDGDIIYTNQYYDKQIRITYSYGHNTVPTSVKELTTLLVVKKILVSADVSENEFDKVSIGPISVASNIGLSRLVNLDSTIDKLKKIVGRFRIVFK